MLTSAEIKLYHLLRSGMVKEAHHRQLLIGQFLPNTEKNAAVLQRSSLVSRSCLFVIVHSS